MITFSYILEKAFRILTGLKFKTSYLSGFPLWAGTTETILALSGKIPWPKQQFIAWVKGSAIVSAPILISFGKTGVTPTVFLMSVSF